MPALIVVVGSMRKAMGRRHLTAQNPGAHDREQDLEQTAVHPAPVCTPRAWPRLFGWFTWHPTAARHHLTTLFHVANGYARLHPPDRVPRSAPRARHGQGPAQRLTRSGAKRVRIPPTQ